MVSSKRKGVFFLLLVVLFFFLVIGGFVLWRTFLKPVELADQKPIWYIRSPKEEMLCWEDSCGWSNIPSVEEMSKEGKLSTVIPKDKPKGIIFKRKLLSLPGLREGQSPLQSYLIGKNYIVFTISSTTFFTESYGDEVSTSEYSAYIYDKKTNKLIRSIVMTEPVWVVSLRPDEKYVLLGVLKRGRANFLIAKTDERKLSGTMAFDKFEWLEEDKYRAYEQDECDPLIVEATICPIWTNLLNCKEEEDYKWDILETMKRGLDEGKFVLEIPEGWEFEYENNKLVKKEQLEIEEIAAGEEPRILGEISFVEECASEREEYEKQEEIREEPMSIDTILIDNTEAELRKYLKPLDVGYAKVIEYVKVTKSNRFYVFLLYTKEAEENEYEGLIKDFETMLQTVRFVK